LRSGIAEIVKYGVIYDAPLFQRLEKQLDGLLEKQSPILSAIIARCCTIKAEIVSQDETETGLRAALNFGHTIGHAIESLQNYQISHGEAVAIGMLVEGFLAVQSGYLSAASLETMRVLLTTYALPLKTTAFQAKSLFLERLTLDKKSIQSRPRFVLLAGIGQPYVHAGQYTHEVHPQHLADALDWAIEHF
jgi:3-dehydroquinate synthase